MRQDPTIGRIWHRVIEPGIAGHFGLPKDVVERVAMVESLRRHLDEVTRKRQDEGNALGREQQLGDAMDNAARADGAFPGADEVIEARRTAEGLEIEARVLADRIVSNEAIYLDKGEMIAFLNQALDEVLASVKGIGPTLESLRFSEDAVLAKGSKGDREAWVEATALVERYAAIRSAQRALHQLSDVGWPSYGTADEGWLEIANLSVVFPAYVPVAGRAAAPPPWPKAPLQRLFWLATGPARPWVPSDDELRETFEQVSQTRRSALAGLRTG